MNHFGSRLKRPVFPQPKANKSTGLLAFLTKQYSWLEGLYRRSYQMKMGEVHLPGIDLYMVNQPALIKQIMVDKVDEFPKHALLDEMLEPLLGHSIFTTNGAVWRRQREMLDVAFDHHQVERVFDKMQASVAQMLVRIDQSKAATGIDIDPEMTRVTADIIFRTIMSSALDSDESQAVIDAFIAYQADSPRYTLYRMFGLSKGPMLRWLDRSRRKKAHIIRQHISRAIEPRYRAFQRTGEDTEPDILAKILTASLPGHQPFSFSEVVDQVAMLFLAGHETSASALTWSIYLLALDQQVQAALYEQVTDRYPADTGWTLASIKRCDKVRHVFMEALRLYPPVGFLTRENSRPQCMRDKPLKQGDLMIISPWLAHRHEKLWADPHDFCPARFDPADPHYQAPKGSYLPFGMGPRICIGVAFAMQEAVLILAELVRHFRIELLPGFEPKPVGRLTVRSDNGLQVKMMRREPAA